MNIKHLSVIVGAVLLLPLLAHAEPQNVGAESSALGNLLWGIFPIVLLVAIFIPLIRRTQKPILKRSQEHMERQVQHMERVEQSLDRIIKLLEKKD